jgi:hypothetical protein
MISPGRLLLPAAALGLLCACSGPRAVMHTPEAAPKGDWRLGGGMDINFPTQTSRALFSGLEGGIDLLYDQVKGSDTAKVAITADSLNDLARALVAYSLDPLGTQPTAFLRYGILDGVDAGYRFAGGAHVFDGRWQFMGPMAGDSSGSSAWRGSLALQYCSQSYELPSLLGKLQSILRYEFKRKDIQVPLVFGKPLGRSGRFGDFGIGTVYNLSVIEYDSQILKLVERVDATTVRPFEDLRGDRTIHAYGVFANARLGYKHVFLYASLAAYSQDYGTYALFGGKKTRLEGWTWTPAYGLEARF